MKNTRESHRTRYQVPTGYKSDNGMRERSESNAGAQRPVKNTRDSHRQPVMKIQPVTKLDNGMEARSCRRHTKREQCRSARDLHPRTKSDDGKTRYEN